MESGGVLSVLLIPYPRNFFKGLFILFQATLIIFLSTKILSFFSFKDLRFFSVLWPTVFYKLHQFFSDSYQILKILNNIVLCWKVYYSRVKFFAILESARYKEMANILFFRS